MLINERIALRTNKIVLVPYCQHHVRTYHRWMKDPDIQAATASEPLSLFEEYRMQQSWRRDADKLTFITCLPHTHHISIEELKAMLGDVNLFILDNEEDSGNISLVGELEVMIAAKLNQKHGLGRAALLVFLRYILKHQNKMLEEYFSEPRVQAQTSCFAYLRVKIKETNSRSIALFESLGFKKTEVSPNFFDEYELRNSELTLEQVEAWMQEREIEDYEEVPYLIMHDEQNRGSGRYCSDSCADSLGSGSQQFSSQE